VQPTVADNSTDIRHTAEDMSVVVVEDTTQKIQKPRHLVVLSLRREVKVSTVSSYHPNDDRYRDDDGDATLPCC